jgi:6-phosphogluconolactonase
MGTLQIDVALHADANAVAVERHTSGGFTVQYRPLFALIAAAALAACSDSLPTAPSRSVAPSLAANGGGAAGAVFTTTNAVAGNAVVAFDRDADGSVSYAGTFPTSGLGIGGTADPLTSQFALTLSPNHQFLFVVNAGSNDVSSFAVDKGNLTLIGKVASGGVRPVSAAASAHTLYVLNAGTNTVAGFDISNAGVLTLRADIVKSLSAGVAGAAAVRLSPDGQFITVAERLSGTFDTWVVGSDGSLSGRKSTASAAAGPFGFDYTPRGQIVVSEAGNGSASSYAQQADGSLQAVTAALSTLQAAPCWLIVNNSGRFAYTANAGSASLTGFAIAADGQLTRLTANGITAALGTGAQPLDLDMSQNGQFLYVFKNGTGKIGAFAVGGDGSLSFIGDASTGLAARAGYMGVAAY